MAETPAQKRARLAAAAKRAARSREVAAESPPGPSGKPPRKRGKFVAKAPETTTGPPSTKAALARVLKLPIASDYVNNPALLKVARESGVDAVALLIAAIAVRAAPNEAGLAALAAQMGNVPEYKNLDAWLADNKPGATQGIQTKIYKNANIQGYQQVFTEKPPPKPPGAKTALARILELPEAQKYVGAANITNIAKARRVDPVGLLVAAIALDVPPNAKGLERVANQLREGIVKGATVGQWLQSKGVVPEFERGILDRANASGYIYDFPQRPKQKAITGKEDKTAREALVDPYVKADAAGNISVNKKTGQVERTNKIEQAFKSATGAAFRVSDIGRLTQNVENTYRDYLGRPPTIREVAFIGSKGMSPGAVQRMLMFTKDKKTGKRTINPKIKTGRIWQMRAPAVIGYLKSLYGEGWKVDSEFVGKAVAFGWDEAVLRQKAIQKPAYLNGPVFKQDVAQLTNVYTEIMGVPDQNNLRGIREAALGGWSSDQFAAWIRTTDAYKTGPEYRARALTFLEQLGLITGQAPTLQDVGENFSATPFPNISGQLPNSPRIQGQPPALADQPGRPRQPIPATGNAGPNLTPVDPRFRGGP